MVCTLTGMIAREEMFALSATLAGAPGFDPAFNALLDLRGANLSTLTAADIAYLASRSKLDATAQRVIVAHRADTFGLARLYETRRSIEGFTIPSRSFARWTPASHGWDWINRNLAQVEADTLS
jgi:hypothetical protein